MIARHPGTDAPDGGKGSDVSSLVLFVEPLLDLGAGGRQLAGFGER